MILEQFQDQLVIILLVAAVVSFILALFEEENSSGSAFVEPIVILLILIANATVGVIQESNAEQAIEVKINTSFNIKCQALKEYSPAETRVIRGGQTIKIASAELVPGDIIELGIGDQIPADCRLLEIYSSSFRVDQAILTGESVSVNKQTEAITDDKAVKQDQINMLFSVSIFNTRAKPSREPPFLSARERQSSPKLVPRQPLGISTRASPLRSRKKRR